MGKSKMVNRVLSLFFVCVLFLGVLKGGSYGELQKLSDYLRQEKDKCQESVTMTMLESDFASDVWKKKELININGLMAKIMKMQGLYSTIGMYVTTDHYIVSASEHTSTDYEYEQTVAFRDFLESNGVKLLYVNEPTKYIDDSLFEREFGVKTYSNQNMDLFLDRISKANVNYIDLRDNIKQENINISDLFYRTDHHWTTNAGLWATQKMAEGLNEKCGYDIDTSIYSIEKYDMTEWKECWLGEQGRKIGEPYVGLDDYTELKPIFETDFTFKYSDGTTRNGTFDDFVNESIYNTQNDVYENDSWHYSYHIIDCINNNVDDGKVLILGDSYDFVTQPFLSLGIHEVDMLILRSVYRKCDDFDLRNYILENGYDTVIIAYAQFMVGAHDDEDSSNYRMFCFGRQVDYEGCPSGDN